MGVGWVVQALPFAGMTRIRFDGSRASTRLSAAPVRLPEERGRYAQTRPQTSRIPFGGMN